MRGEGFYYVWLAQISHVKLPPILSGSHSRTLPKLPDKIGLIGKSDNSADMTGGNPA